MNRLSPLLALVAALLFAAGGAQADANPATYMDPAGDSGNAPDITSILVSNSPNDQIVFRINMTGLVVPSDTKLLVAIDSDRNPSTGNNGTDYLLLTNLSDGEVGLLRWDGAEFADTRELSLSFGRDDGSVFFSVNAGDLGNTTGFDFWVRSVAGAAFATAHEDTAPDTGTFPYVLGPGVVPQLTIKRLQTTRARAGKPFIAVVTVARSDEVPMDLTLEDLRCNATAGGHRLRVAAADALGEQAGCLWNLARKTKGQTLRASVTIMLDGGTVTKTFTAKIR